MILQRVMPVLRAGTVLIGASVAISTALDNVLLAIVLLGILFNARAVAHIAMHNPVARAAWLLFGALCIATLYGATPWREAIGVLGKYIDLAFIPLFMLMLSDETNRQRAQQAFLAAMGLTLFLSYLIGLELLPIQRWMYAMASIDDPVIFRGHITQNNLMAFAAFLALLKCRAAVSNRLRIGWGLFAGLAAVNVLFMVQGRTGYLILFVLLAWTIWATLADTLHRNGKRINWRHAAAILLLLTGLATIALSVPSRLQDKINIALAEQQTWQRGGEKDTSIGDRLSFYQNTLNIIKQQPWLGVGTGGLEAAYARQIQGTTDRLTPNPHNEYLMITAQVGVFGLLLLCYLFYTLWRSAAMLENRFNRDAVRGLVLAYLISCMFNSSLLDHVDGLFFAFMTAVLFANLKVARHD